MAFGALHTGLVGFEIVAAVVAVVAVVIAVVPIFAVESVKTVGGHLGSNNFKTRTFQD